MKLEVSKDTSRTLSSLRIILREDLQKITFYL